MGLEDDPGGLLHRSAPCRRVFADRVSHSATYQLVRKSWSLQHFGRSSARPEGRRSSWPCALRRGVHSRDNPGCGGSLRSDGTILNPSCGRIHVDLGLISRTGLGGRCVHAGSLRITLGEFRDRLAVRWRGGLWRRTRLQVDRAHVPRVKARRTPMAPIPIHAAE